MDALRSLNPNERKIMNLVNLTPHAITIQLDGDQQLTVPPSGVVARARTKRTPISTSGPYRLISQKLGDVEGLPENPTPNTLYVVSGLVLAALAADGQSYPHIVAPDSGPDAIREGGQVVAVRGFVAL
jgi:hypothetical protein